MLISTNEVANRLKITNRAVQIKCKQYGIVKIGNQYQITKEIAEQWYKDLETNIETKTKRSNEISKTSHRSNKNSSLLFWVCFFILIAILLKFYLNLDRQIKETKEELHQERTEHKTDVKELRKIVDSQKDIITSKEIEIQRLKIKDSLRLFKP